MPLPRLFTASPPAYPNRAEAVLAPAMDRLRSGAWVRLEGTPELEADLQTFHGGGTVWFLASGTAALEALLLGHEIGPGDEVVTTPYTWGATVAAILAVGAIPRFADVDAQTGLLTPATVAAALTPQTKAILAVHLYGHPCDAAGLRALADARGILLFEDGSQAHGARWQGQRVGRFGHGSAFSCMGLKLLGGLEGGYAIFEQPDAAERAFLYGRHPRGLAAEAVTRLGAAGLLDALQLGWRPCPVSADLVQAHLPLLDGENAGRRSNAAHLRRHLESIPGVTLPAELPGAEGCYHLLSLLHDPAVTGHDLDTFAARLRETGLECFRYLPLPIHRLARLNPVDYHGPRVLWHDQLRRAGINYRHTRCPGADWRCAHSIEFAFNWTVEDEPAMAQFAAAVAAAAGR